MAQPTHIELETGSDRFYRRAVALIWLLAAAVLVDHVQTLSPLLLCAGCALLLGLRPGRNDPSRQSHRLRLYRNGTAALGDQTGTWGARSWSCRWYAVLRLDLSRRARHVLISTSRNSADEYRRLLVWSRFAPFGEKRA
jgi:hypothetical protein